MVSPRANCKNAFKSTRAFSVTKTAAADASHSRYLLKKNPKSTAHKTDAPPNANNAPNHNRVQLKVNSNSRNSRLRHSQNASRPRKPTAAMASR